MIWIIIDTFKIYGLLVTFWKTTCSSVCLGLLLLEEKTNEDVLS
jgi:hypothetical protein